MIIRDNYEKATTKIKQIRKILTDFGIPTMVGNITPGPCEPDSPTLVVSVPQSITTAMMSLNLTKQL
jgi:hypothetical protein